MVKSVKPIHCIIQEIGYTLITNPPQGTKVKWTSIGKWPQNIKIRISRLKLSGTKRKCSECWSNDEDNLCITKNARFQPAAIAIDLLRAMHCNICIAFYAWHSMHCILCIAFYALHCIIWISFCAFCELHSKR